MRAAAGAVMGGALLVQIAASPSPAHAWMVQAGAIPPSQAEMPHATQPKVKIMSTNIHASLNGTPWTVVENAFSDKTAEFPGRLTFNGDQLRLDGPCNFFTTQIMVHAQNLRSRSDGSRGGAAKCLDARHPIHDLGQHADPVIRRWETNAQGRACLNPTSPVFERSFNTGRVS